MKKILTLLVMFLATWSILGAQTPVFGYQAVVRTADNEIVENTPVEVTITVLNGDTEVYSEMHTNKTTDGLGMISLLVGTGIEKTGDILDVDWSQAVIRTDLEIDGGELVSFESEVMAAPYAMQALETVLTTDRIVHYVEGANINDYAECMEALNDNIPQNGQMWQLTRERIINYIKNHRDIALEVSVAYLESATEQDFNDVYGDLQNDAISEGLDIVAETAIANRGFAIEVLIGYLESATPAEVDEVIDSILEHEDDILPYVVDFLIDNRARVLNLLNTFLASAEASEVESALSVFNDDSGMKQKLVYELFFNHLDNYLQPTNLPADEDIKGYVEQKVGDDYLKKECNGTEVDICDMRDQVDEMMGN